MEALGIQGLNAAQMSLFVTVTYRQKVDWRSPEAGGRGDWRATAHGYKVSFWGNENVLESDSADGFTIL